MSLRAVLILLLATLLTSTAFIDRSYSAEPNVVLVVLGIAQDAGYPQIGCEKECCRAARDVALHRQVSCIGLIETSTGQAAFFDATPDFTFQHGEMRRALGQLQDVPRESVQMDIVGVFLTHAHIGHYTGLMYLGREAMGARQVPVFAMPRMKRFLESSGPWSQLVELENIVPRELSSEVGVKVFPAAPTTITPLLVPHRDEFSETVGFRIDGPNKSVLFVPDIDKWEKWDRDIVQLVRDVDYAFIDASFYNGDELPGRDMSEIPHPSIVESMALLDSLGAQDRRKVNFIHFNHTNPVLRATEQRRAVRKAGYQIAEQGLMLEL